jgi:hypothetical protein
MGIADRRFSRRGFLARAALTGSALTVAPVRLLTQPVSAQRVVHCNDCSSGSKCCGAYTAFCCEINADNSNTCPDYTHVGGWWKCSHYSGHSLCDKQGFRYYIDCNRNPAQSCPGGCHCANDDCSDRKACCNVFAYGQCNPGVRVTEIACRVVKCDRPCDIFRDCNCSPYMEDNNTCSHEAGCLQTADLGPPGLGGRH